MDSLLTTAQFSSGWHLLQQTRDATLLCSRCIHHVSRVFPSHPLIPLAQAPSHRTATLFTYILIHWPLGSWRAVPCACIWILSWQPRSVQHSGDAHQMFVKARRKECWVICIIHSLEQCFTQSRHSTDIVKWKETEKKNCTYSETGKTVSKVISWNHK